MKKIRVLLLLTIFLCIIPFCIAFAAKTGTVTANYLNIRKTASSSGKVVGVLRKGATVTIKDTCGSWYKITSGNKSGYVYKSYIKVGGSSSGSGKTSSSSSSSSSSKKPDSKTSSDGTCGPGSKGAAVKKVQRRLKQLGYYSGSIDGDYGNGTKTAVKDFQRKNGLSVNGTVNSKTLKKLNSSDAKKASSSGSSKSSNGTERLDWFHGGSSKIPKGATFQVKDIKTGKVFTCKRWSGYNHLDAEPLTAKDASTMKSIYGHWSWRRRAVLVKYNGHVYAASMNGMPHGTQTIKGNKFDGHFCIHFYKSKTHGSGKVDSAHQKCVETAMHHKW